MKKVIETIKHLFDQDDLNVEYECNQVLNYNNFSHKGRADSASLYEVCAAKF